MAMPSTSLTFGDKFLIKILSALLFLFSSFSFWYYGHDKQRVRSIGISNLPLGFALFCKYARPFASNEKRKRLLEARKKHDHPLVDSSDDYDDDDDNDNDDDHNHDPLDDPAFVRNCLLWSIVQFLCVVSGVFNWYPDIIIKGAVIFHILLTVQDSIETRPIELHKEELRLKRKRKLQLESAQFWKFFLPRPIWKLLGFENIVKEATTMMATPKVIVPKKISNDDDVDGVDDNPKKKQQQQKKKKEEIIRKVHTAKNVVRGKRKTAVDDLIWGGIQIAYVAFDVTHKQAIGTAFMVYLCTLLEDVVSVIISTTNDDDDDDDDGEDSDSHKEKKKKNKINWFKISWIILCVYFTGKWFFS